MTTDQKKVHVAAAPPSKLETDLVKKVAEVIGKEPYDTRLLLVGETPRILAHCGSEQEAEALRQNLGDLGLVAFICEDSELRGAASEGLLANTLEFQEKEILFRDKGGREKRLKAEEAFLILKGKLQGYTEEESTKFKMKFSKKATLMTGGVPVWRPTTERTTSEVLKEEFFVRLYSRESSEPVAEMMVNHMDYSFLGSELATSSPANFNIVVEKLRKFFPSAIFDDRLMRPFKVDVPTSELYEALNINCTLLYSYHREVG